MKLGDAVRNPPEILDPGWQRWLDLVALAVTESQHPAWSGSVLVHDPESPDAPLLHGATLRLDPARSAEFVRMLSHRLGIPAADHLDPVALIRAGVVRDVHVRETLAGHLAVSADTVALLTQLSALPLLINAARALAPDASRTWQRGYCPVCGAWPAIVEMRGIQRERRMRCGCCGSDWLLPVLRCAFCNESDHRKLGFLLPDVGDQQVRVETCATCQGYLKAIATLGALPFTTLAERDLSTIAFDLAARDRGYSRPERPAWLLQTGVVR